MICIEGIWKDGCNRIAVHEDALDGSLRCFIFFLDAMVFGYTFSKIGGGALCRWLSYRGQWVLTSLQETTIYEETSVQTNDATVRLPSEAIPIAEPAPSPVMIAETAITPTPLSTQAVSNPKTWPISETPGEEFSMMDVEQSIEEADTDNNSSTWPSSKSSSSTETLAEEPSITDVEPNQEDADIDSSTSISSSPKSSSSIIVQSPAAGVIAVPEKPHAVSERPLILYAYSETESARINLEFFIAHGLHANADFVFILNGPTNAPDIIPQEPNIHYVRRPNDCYDLGAYAEVLIKDDLYKGYKHFIMLNASIRGPFLPYWAEGCWSDMYLKRVTDEVKVLPPFAVPTKHLLTRAKACRYDS